MSVKSDVIVVGGGVVGTACARELRLAGRQVCVVDADSLGGEAWKAAAGMLAPQIEGDDGDPLFELGLGGREYYVTRAEELESATGIDIGLWQGGILRVARSEQDVENLKRRVAWQRQHGHLCDWLDATEVKAAWGWLAGTLGALWAPRDGAVQPLALVAALRKDATRLGVRFESDRVTGLVRTGARVTGVQGSSRIYSGGDVVLAAGAWSGRLTGLPRPLSVEPVRGQMAALPWPSGIAPAIVYGGAGSYVLHRDGEALVGSTMEHVGFASETDEAGQQLILSAARAIVPSLAPAPVLRAWAGLRPVTPDGVPILGREPRAEGLWYATGHGRNGILLAGITATVIRHLLAGEPTIEDLEPLRPERFWE